MNRMGLVGAIVAVTIGLGLYYLLEWDRGSAALTVKVKLPSTFSSEATAGQVLFEANCAKCHGKNAAGTNVGPPLVHIIYETGHHGDVSFYRAAKNGTQGHHWPYGNMPAINTVVRADVSQIITYVRELQRANGIN